MGASAGVVLLAHVGEGLQGLLYREKHPPHPPRALRNRRTTAEHLCAGPRATLSRCLLTSTIPSSPSTSQPAFGTARSVVASARDQKIRPRGACVDSAVHSPVRHCSARGATSTTNSSATKTSNTLSHQPSPATPYRSPSAPAAARALPAPCTHPAGVEIRSLSWRRDNRGS